MFFVNNAGYHQFRKIGMSKVYFIPASEDEGRERVTAKVRTLVEKAGLESRIGPKDLVALKIHFGEKGNTTHIPPEYVRPVVEAVKRKGGKPFLTDSNVLYRSERDNAVDHLVLAASHGFTVENIGAPVLIADGLLGSAEKEVEIRGQLFQKISVSATAAEAGAVVVLTHVTGHMNSGLGGAIKNLGMGFASRKGKLQQHSTMKPSVSPKRCTGCQVCIRWCPADAIAMAGPVALIDGNKCIGCGECITVCRFDAVKHDWRASSMDLQKRMAEYALGMVSGHDGKIMGLNFVLSVTKDCDCLNGTQTPVIPDIGILCGEDPVALDAASLNVIEAKTGKKLMDLSYPEIDPWIQIRHGEAIGLGSSTYSLVEVS